MVLVPKHIKNLRAYKAGKPISEVKRELKLNNVIKLASNENPLGPSQVAIDKVKKILTKTHRYPDSNGYDLRLKLSEKFDLDMSQMSIKFCEVQDFMTSVIIGATTMEQLKTNVESVKVNLDSEVIKEINNVQKKYPNPCP